MKAFAAACIGLAGLAFSSLAPLSPSPPPPPAGGGPVFDDSLPAFQAGLTNIAWTAPTNTSHIALWVYKVAPQNFSGAAVSNLMALGSFSVRDEHKWRRPIGAANGQPLLFINASNTADLLIAPAQGWIKYHDQYAPANRWDKVKHLHEQVEGLPDEKEAETLGLQFLKGFGIERADLVQRDDGHLITFGTEEKRSYFYKATGKYVDDEVISRGIYFDRRIDGVSFAGIGLGSGCEIEFGNHGKIAELNLVWRNLQPYALYAIALPGEIMQRIPEGKAVLTHKNMVSPGEIKKLTITGMSPLYQGAPGGKSQEWVCPFAQLEAVADMGGTNVNVQLYCPILSTNAVSATVANNLPRTGRKIIPGECLDVLENADSFTLLSLDPEEWRKSTNNFYGFPILGRIQINAATDRRKILDAMYGGVSLGGLPADCFNPRHGIHVTKGNQFEDLVICFECGQVYFHGVSEGQLSVNRSPAEVLSRFLSAAHVPVGK